MNKLGFTLIECMVALAMTVVVSLSVSYMITSTQSGQKGHSRAMDCNQVLRNIMEQISSIGYKKKYGNAYDSGKLNPVVLDKDIIKNHVLIEGDIIDVLRSADTSIFNGQFIKGKNLLNETVPGRKNKFNVGNSDALEYVFVKFERQAWDLSEDKLYEDCKTVNTSKTCEGTCCPRPSSICKMDETNKAECTVCLDSVPLKDCTDDKLNILGRSDLGYKIKTSLRVCKRGEDCSGSTANDKIAMQCDLDRVFQYAPDVTPIVFDKDKEVELSSEVIEGVSCTSSTSTVNASNLSSLKNYAFSNLPSSKKLAISKSINFSKAYAQDDPQEVKTIPGYSCLFKHNGHNGNNKCGKAINYNNPSVSFTAKFEVNKTKELKASVLYCRVDHIEFKANANYKAAPADGSSSYDLKDGSWEICGKPNGTSTGEMTINQQVAKGSAPTTVTITTNLNTGNPVFVDCRDPKNTNHPRCKEDDETTSSTENTTSTPTTNKPGSANFKDIKVTPGEDSFQVEFYYDIKRDVDYKVSVVAIDPAGNPSDVKTFTFASQNCALYKKDAQQTYCGANQWCTLDRRNPWADLPQDKYKHRQNSTCNYYNIKVGDFTKPNSIYDKWGCGSRCRCEQPSGYYRNKHDYKPDDKGCCFYNEKCLDMLNDNNHFRNNCQKPSCISCACDKYHDVNGKCPNNEEA